KLLQAHYAGAIPVDLLKTEQDRIRASLEAITNRLDTLATTYDQAKVGLDAILDASPRPHNERTLPRDHVGQGSNVQLYVDPRRIELLTSCLQSRHSTN